MNREYGIKTDLNFFSNSKKTSTSRKKNKGRIRLLQVLELEKVSNIRTILLLAKLTLQVEQDFGPI